MAKRKTYNRRADIPAGLLRKLNTGLEESLTLAEFLAVDQEILLKNVSKHLRLGPLPASLLQVAKDREELGIMECLRGIGSGFDRMGRARQAWKRIFKKLSTHKSDIVREWAAFMVLAEPKFSLKKRIAMSKLFASDHNMSVREVAWCAFRPHLAKDLRMGIRLLQPWVRHKNHNLRRCAIEATRPRGVWTEHIRTLREKPEIALALLEQVKSDSADYVARSVANWLNDASKDNPKWVLSLCKRWLRESPTKETKWIVNHATRTIRKGDQPRAYRGNKA